MLFSLRRLPLTGRNAGAGRQRHYLWRAHVRQYDGRSVAEPLRYAAGNKTPFYISHGSDDFDHVRQSSDDMVAALKAAGCAVTNDTFDGMDHYHVNPSHGDGSGRWVQTVCGWMAKRG